jgi:hypothetical protein
MKITRQNETTQSLRIVFAGAVCAAVVVGVAVVAVVALAVVPLVAVGVMAYVASWALWAWARPEVEFAAKWIGEAFSAAPTTLAFDGVALVQEAIRDGRIDADPTSSRKSPSTSPQSVALNST